ncbi:MAG: LytTR family DNA-binding domain-containing protein [Bacteroidota bacterium]
MARAAIRCLIIDDEEMATKVIESHLSNIPGFEVVGIFHSGVEAFLALDHLAVDVLFLDIQMPKMTGLELLKMLDPKPLAVLTTAHREYALDGFDLEVVDYLLKPIGFKRFLQTASRLKKRLYEEAPRVTSPEPKLHMQTPEEDHLFIKTNRAYQKVAFCDILHIESVKNHVKLVCRSEDLISLMTLSDLLNQLPASFLRVHRSFVVNTGNLIRFDNKSIQHEKGIVPIGRKYKEAAWLTLQGLVD